MPVKSRHDARKKPKTQAKKSAKHPLTGVPAPKTRAKSVDLESSPFRLMAHIMNQQLAALSRNLRPLGISAPMSRILTGLREAGDATITDLAEHSGFERSYVSRLLDQLTATGLAERIADPIDRRQRLIRLTAAGRQLQLQAASIVAQLTRRHLSSLSTNDSAQLRELLTRISQSYRHLDKD
jgi:DNA-binding MarR family transcriptional regulator